MRSIRYYGFCHSAAKVKRERIAFHTGRPLLLGAPRPAAAQASPSALHLPVLRWGNETYCQLPPTLARPSRPAAQEKEEAPRRAK